MFYFFFKVIVDLIEKVSKAYNIDDIKLTSYILGRLCTNSSKKLYQVAKQIEKGELVSISQLSLDECLYLINLNDGLGKESFRFAYKN